MSHDLNESEERTSKRIKTAEVDESTHQTIYNEKVFENDLILNHIFKNLTARELQAVSRVCKNWHNQCSKLNKLNAETEDLFLVYGLTNYMRNQPDRFSRLMQLKDLKNYDNLKDEVLNSIKSKDKLQTVPSIALFFNSFRGSKQKNYSSFIKSSKFVSSLPRSCSIISLSCTNTGVIGNSPNNEYSVETMQDTNKFISGISYLFLPDLTEFGCQVIPIKGCQSELCRYLNEEQIVEHSIKGVLTFIKYDTSGSPDLTILRELIGQQSNKVALGGILIEDIDISSNVDCKKSDKDAKTMIETDFAALMFCGENVNCASVIIKDSVEEDVKKRLVDFKNSLHFDCNQNGSELFGFLFACAGRSFNIFDRLNLESDLIKEQFPKMRMYGIHGLGEIGLNYFGNNRSNKIQKNTVLHYYTTVLVLVQIVKSKIYH